MFCSQCGSKIIAGSQFCNKCGAKIILHENEPSLVDDIIADDEVNTVYESSNESNALERTYNEKQTMQNSSMSTDIGSAYANTEQFTSPNEMIISKVDSSLYKKEKMMTLDRRLREEMSEPRYMIRYWGTILIVVIILLIGLGNFTNSTRSMENISSKNYSLDDLWEMRRWNEAFGNIHNVKVINEIISFRIIFGTILSLLFAVVITNLVFFIWKNTHQYVINKASNIYDLLIELIESERLIAFAKESIHMKQIDKLMDKGIFAHIVIDWYDECLLMYGISFKDPMLHIRYGANIYYYIQLAHEALHGTKHYVQ